MKKTLREIRFYLEYLAVLPVVLLARGLSEANAERLVKIIARLAYHALSFDRRWAYRNLEMVFGDNLTSERRREIVMGAFETVVRTRVECIRWTKEWMLKNVVEEGGEATRAAAIEYKRQGKGLIILTAHLGNFELLPAYCHQTGHPSTVMYRPQDNWRVEKLLLGARTEYLPNVVRRSTTGLMTLGYVVREGTCVGLLVDMNTLDNPAYVDFLGYKAASPPGAAALAVSTGAPVVLALSVRDADGKHRMIFHPPFETIRTGNKREDIRRNTEQYMKAIEPYVRAYPEQYNWLHPRWRYRPDGTFWSLETPMEEILAERDGSPRTLTEDPTPEEIVRTRMDFPRAAA